MNHTTRCYPRTLEQAFGPYQRGEISEPRSMDKSDRIVVISSAIAAIFLIVWAVL